MLRTERDNGKNQNLYHEVVIAGFIGGSNVGDGAGGEQTLRYDFVCSSGAGGRSGYNTSLRGTRKGVKSTFVCSDTCFKG